MSVPMIDRVMSFSGTASPRPMPATAVLMPTTWPALSTSAPPPTTSVPRRSAGSPGPATWSGHGPGAALVSGQVVLVNGGRVAD
jgi:hypothetical protein